MRKLFSTRINAGAFNTGMLLMRLGFGILLANHGFNKLTHYAETKIHMMNFLGMGTTTTTVMVIFAEFFCAILVIIGLFTRFACIPIIILMSVALFRAHNGDILGDGEMAGLYLLGYITLLITGPGKVSIDSMISK
ncbi:DoxX family protein [soil metagenome]